MFDKFYFSIDQRYGWNTTHALLFNDDKKGAAWLTLLYFRFNNHLSHKSHSARN